jgi:hypothetical protein
VHVAVVERGEAPPHSQRRMLAPPLPASLPDAVPRQHRGQQAQQPPYTSYIASCRYLDEFNAVHQAHTPTLDALKAAGPRRWRLLKAHGTAVGLPTDDDMGNSEVGWVVRSPSRQLGVWHPSTWVPCCHLHMLDPSRVHCRALELAPRLPCPPGCLQVGHNALGAGQIVDQGAKCVDAALASGEHEPAVPAALGLLRGAAASVAQ